MKELDDLISSVKSQRFFLIEGEPNADLKAAVDESMLPVGEQYKDFVRRYGSVKLFRKGSQYLIYVLRSPHRHTYQGDRYLWIGGTDESKLFYNEEVKGKGEPSVYEWSNSRGFTAENCGFNQWLTTHIAASIKRYSPLEWRRIVSGNGPFTEEEARIVEARRLFSWIYTGFSDGQYSFVVKNGSKTRIPFLTISVKDKTNEFFEGGIWLPVGEISPGQEKRITRECYKNIVRPSDILFISKEEPTPDDKDRYWEFKDIKN
jgi:hypothetical protein